MSKSVERLTRKQLGAATLERSVTIVYGDFSSEIANKCYRELVRAQLPEKLVQAGRGLDHLSTRESVLVRLQKGLMHPPTGDRRRRSDDGSDPDVGSRRGESAQH